MIFILYITVYTRIRSFIYTISMYLSMYILVLKFVWLHISIYEKIWKKILIHFPNKYSQTVKKKKENHFPAHLWIPGVCVRAFWFDWSTVTGWFTTLGAGVGGGEVFAEWRVPSWESSWNKGEGVWQLSPSYCTAFVITTTEHTSRLGP